MDGARPTPRSTYTGTLMTSNRLHPTTLGSLTLALALAVGGVAPASAATSLVVDARPAASSSVALTFDDGWSLSSCARITRTLRAQRVVGTFFINGSQLARAPQRWRRVLRGQQIANHAYRHFDLTSRSNFAVRKLIRKNELIHERILGRPMLKIFRPPYGAYDARVLRIAGRQGYSRTALWSVDSRDWDRATTVDEVIARSTGADPGAIILMHCSDNATPDALPTIIRHYKSRGIKLVGLKQLLGIRA